MVMSPLHISRAQFKWVLRNRKKSNIHHTAISVHSVHPRGVSAPPIEIKFVSPSRLLGSWDPTPWKIK